MEEIKKKIKNKGGRIQANVRRKSALEQLEKHYNAFKNKGGHNAVNKAFGQKLDEFIDEINGYMYSA